MWFLMGGNSLMTSDSINKNVFYSCYKNKIIIQDEIWKNQLTLLINLSVSSKAKTN